MADTIFALSSGRPPAAIAVIRVSGPQAHTAGIALAGSLPSPRQAAMRELRHPATGERIDQALVLRFDAPASSTGEDSVEFHGHGGRAVVDAVLAALSEIEGLRLAEPGEFTRRAFFNGRIDLTEAEGLADLIEAETEAQRKAALALAEGGLRQQIERWQSKVVELSARAEQAIDYDDDDDPLDPAIAREAERLARELGEWLDRPRAELLKDGVLVVVAGPPNAGKSSIINAIAEEERAIVTPFAGTTRDHIEVPIALGGMPVRLTDTAGLRVTDDPVEAIGVERAERLAQLAEVLLWMGDEPPAEGHSKMILVHAKADLPERHSVPEGRLAVSCTTGAGLPELLAAIEREVRSMLPDEGSIALNFRQRREIAAARDELSDASTLSDPILIAEGLRIARSAFDRLTGRAGVEDMLDLLFGRFCLGK